MPRIVPTPPLTQFIRQIELYVKLVDTIIPNVLALGSGPDVFRSILIDHYNILFPRDFSEQELRNYILALIITLFSDDKEHIEKSQSLLPKMCILVGILTATRVTYRLAGTQDRTLINELLDHSLKSVVPVSVATVLGIGIFDPHSILGHSQLEAAVRKFYTSLESEETTIRFDDSHKNMLAVVQQIIIDAFNAFYNEHNISDRSSIEGFEQALKKAIEGFFIESES